MLRNIVTLFGTVSFLVLRVFGVFWLMGSFLPAKDRIAATGTIGRLLQSARVHHTRVGTYEGSCQEIGVPDTYTCRDDDEGALIYGRISANMTMCGDATGFVGEVSNVPQKGVLCSQ